MNVLSIIYLLHVYSHSSDNIRVIGENGIGVGTSILAFLLEAMRPLGLLWNRISIQRPPSF